MRLPRFWTPRSRDAVIGAPYLWLGLFFLLPFMLVLRISLAQMDGAQVSPLVTLAGGELTFRFHLTPYLQLLSDDLYLHAYLVSLKYALVTTVLCLLIGYPFAYFMARSEPRWQPALLMGVMLTHYNIANNGFLTGEHMKFTADDKLCVCVPLFHCFGVVLATMNCLTHGCTEVMVERFNPLVVLASIHKERCTALYGVPTMFIAELNHPMFDMFDMSSLRTGIMAGSLCPVELMKQVEEKMYMKVTSVYGLTEAAPGMTATRIDDPFDVRCNTVGHDFEHTEVKVIDPETGEECPVGVQGEMCNRGYNTMKGYYKKPEATAEVIDENGFLHSGDLGVKDEDGNYRITGRIKDMIIRGGENIYPREIEEFLYQLEGVKDVQVAGIPSKKYGEAVGAFIILHEGVDMHESDVRDFCIGKISRYKIPKYIFFIKEFPMTGSGKIQKFKLKDLGLQLCKEQGIEIV